MLPSTRGRIRRYAEWRPNQPRGRTVLKQGDVIDTVRYPADTLFPDEDVFPQGDVVDNYTYVLTDSPTVDQVNAAAIAYLGGHIYEVTDEEAAALEAAGYVTTPSNPDTIGPALSILGPANDANVSGTFTIRLSYEPSATIEASLTQGNNVTNLTWIQGASTLAVDSTTLDNGVYRLKATAHDAAGNATTVWVDINIVNVIIP